MCFAFQAANAELSAASPYVEIGFSLPESSAAESEFIPTIETVFGTGLPAFNEGHALTGTISASAPR